MDRGAARRDQQSLDDRADHLADLLGAALLGRGGAGAAGGLLLRRGCRSGAPAGRGASAARTHRPCGHRRPAALRRPAAPAQARAADPTDHVTRWHHPAEVAPRPAAGQDLHGAAPCTVPARQRRRRRRRGAGKTLAEACGAGDGGDADAAAGCVRAAVFAQQRLATLGVCDGAESDCVFRPS